MKSKFLILFFIISSVNCLGQESKQDKQKDKLYFYWGWNRGFFSKSNIRFTGENYDFNLTKVIAKDRQSTFNFKTYFSPVSFTIPQYNFRVGYFINNHYDVSFGIDHMKYVVVQDQQVEINGYIENSQTSYNGIYNQHQIIIQHPFLKFEHTDGLNYFNFDIRRNDHLFRSKKFTINILEGFGLGGLLPKTNSILLNNERHDNFHLSGYGINFCAALNLRFFELFFIQSEFKGGFIHMPSIRTTNNKMDNADQSFFFGQYNIVFGLVFKIKN